MNLIVMVRRGLFTIKHLKTQYMSSKIGEFLLDNLICIMTGDGHGQVM